jgi:hypothetical protein
VFILTNITAAQITNIILDFSALSSIDPAGAAQVKKLTDEFRDIDVTITIAGCSGKPFFIYTSSCNAIRQILVNAREYSLNLRNLDKLIIRYTVLKNQ